MWSREQMQVYPGNVPKRGDAVEHGIEWMKSLSRVRLFVTLWTVAYQASLFIGFSRQEYWSGLPFPSPGSLPNPGIEPRSPSLQGDSLLSEPPGSSSTFLLPPNPSGLTFSSKPWSVPWVWASCPGKWPHSTLYFLCPGCFLTTYLPLSSFGHIPWSQSLGIPSSWYTVCSL